MASVVGGRADDEGIVGGTSELVVEKEEEGTGRELSNREEEEGMESWRGTGRDDDVSVDEDEDEEDEEDDEEDDGETREGGLVSLL